MFRILYADVSEHCYIFICRYLRACKDGTGSFPKRRHIKFRRRGITQKKAYNIQKSAKVWNQEKCSDLEDTGRPLSQMYDTCSSNSAGGRQHYRYVRTAEHVRVVEGNSR